MKNPVNDPMSRLERFIRFIPSSRALALTAALMACALLGYLWWVFVAAACVAIADPLARSALTVGATLLLVVAPLLAISIWLLAIARRSDERAGDLE